MRYEECCYNVMRKCSVLWHVVTTTVKLFVIITSVFECFNEVYCISDVVYFDP